MEIKVSVTEFKELCKSIQRRPEELFKMMREEIRETIGEYKVLIFNGNITLLFLIPCLLIPN